MSLPYFSRFWNIQQVLSSSLCKRSFVCTKCVCSYDSLPTSKTNSRSYYKTFTNSAYTKRNKAISSLSSDCINSATKHNFSSDTSGVDASDTSVAHLSSQNRFTLDILTLDQIYQHIADDNGRDIVVMKLDKRLNYVEYFIIVTANSTRHLSYMAESLNKLYKACKKESDPFTVVEGKRVALDWQCLDIGNAVVHFMLEEVREKYQLEKLWLLGPQFDDQLRETPTMEEILQKASDQGLFLLSEQQDSAEFLEDVDIVNPWEMDYKKDSRPNEPSAEDDDAYII